MLKQRKSQAWEKFGYPVLISIDFHDFTSPFYFLVFVSIEKIYHTLKTVFQRLSKHLKLHQKYSAAHSIVDSVLGVRMSRWNTVSCVWYITWKTKHLPKAINDVLFHQTTWSWRTTEETVKKDVKSRSSGGLILKIIKIQHVRRLLLLNELNSITAYV